MSEDNTNPNSGSGDEAHQAQRPHGGARGRKVRFGIAAALLLGAGIVMGGLGAAALNASAFGGHGGGEGHGHHGHGRGPGHMMERAQDRVEWMLSKVDATPEQQSEVEAIVSETMERVTSFRKDKRGARHEFMAELLQSEINRDKLEQLRQRHLAAMDQMSAVVVDGAARAAEVLTPEQRAKISEEMASKRRPQN